MSGAWGLYSQGLRHPWVPRGVPGLGFFTVSWDKLNEWLHLRKPVHRPEIFFFLQFFAFSVISAGGLLAVLLSCPAEFGYGHERVVMSWFQTFLMTLPMASLPRPTIYADGKTWKSRSSRTVNRGQAESISQQMKDAIVFG